MDIAFKQNTPLMQHGDIAGDHLDELHVVFDNDQRVIALELVNQFRPKVDSWLVMPAAGSSNKDQIGIRPGNHGDFNELPLPVGKPADDLAGEVLDAELFQYFVDRRRHFLSR